MQTLDQIALKHGTDKNSTVHGYTKYYEQHFEPIRDQPLVLLEIGYGGYEFPDRGGEGHRTWLEYFPKAKIVSIDIHKKDHHRHCLDLKRSLFMQCSQDDPLELDNVLIQFGTPDIIIDDGSHINPLTCKTFQLLFPELKSGGLYVIEDLESAHWGDIAVDGTDFKGCKDYRNFSAPTILNFLRTLLLDVNEKYIDSYSQEYAIEAMHFYSNICFIKKK